MIAIAVRYSLSAWMSPLTVTPSVAWAAAAAIDSGVPSFPSSAASTARARYGASPTPVRAIPTLVIALPPSLKMTAATPTIE